jgi:hypothetical protein
MPTDRTLAATASLATGKKRETHVGRWLDINDPITSDLIEVRNSRTIFPLNQEPQLTWVRA